MKLSEVNQYLIRTLNYLLDFFWTNKIEGENGEGGSNICKSLSISPSCYIMIDKVWRFWCPDETTAVVWQQKHTINIFADIS